MKRDHIGFFLFLVLLLIAPKIVVPGVAADTSGPSMGAIGLLIWGILSPKHLTLIRYPGVLALPLGSALFGFYSLIITLVPWNPATPISIAYALQYLFYFLFGFLLLSGYCVQAISCRQFHIIIRIFSIVGFIYALGAIVSVITGPIYPHQVIYTARQWSGYYIQQAVGFSDSQNGTGGMLVFFAALSFFRVPKNMGIKHWGLFSIIFAALLLTLSRGAIYSFCLSMLLFTLLRLVSTARIERQVFIFVLGFILVALLAFVFILVMFPNVLSLASAIKEGLDPVESSGTVSADKDIRLELWQQGMNNWFNASSLQQIFGKGFRGSITFDGESWKTPHNLYIAMLGDFGLVGLFIFLFPLVWMVIRLAVQVLWVRHPGMESFAFVSLTGLLIDNTTETYLYSPADISMMLLTMIIAALDLHSPEILNKS